MDCEKQLKSTGRKKYQAWTEDDIREAASHYTSRADLAKFNKPAYEAARLLGMLDSLYTLQLNQWDQSSIKKEAAKFNSRTEFARKSGAAYNAARRLGILSDLFDSKLKSWGISEIESLASQCTHKKDLKRKNATAYNAALRLGIIDKLFDNQGRVKERDCVYLWAVVGEHDLYKVGITSSSMGEYRIHQVAKEAGVTPNIIMLLRVGYEEAKVIERKMKRLGRPYKFQKKFFGHSEFRYLTPNEVNECIRLATRC